MKALVLVAALSVAVFADSNRDYQLALARVKIRALKRALSIEPAQKHRYIKSQIKVQREIIALLRKEGD